MRRILTAAVVAAAIAVSTGCAHTPPPVSEKVQKAYEEGLKQTALPTAAAKPVVAFLGDSFTAGDGLADRRFRWSTVLAAKAGWVEVNAGLGGTGYEAAGKASNGTAYIGRLPSVASEKPAIVVISGGGNDGPVQRDSPALVEDAVRATFAGVRKALPEARIIALSPDWGVDAPDPAIAAIDATVRSAAASVKAEYVDLKRPLDGKKYLMLPDGGHPDVGGHAAIAEAAYKAIKRN